MSACIYCQAPVTAKSLPNGGVQLWGCPQCYNPLLLDWSDATPQVKPLPKSPDIRQTAPEGSIGAALLEALPRAMEKLPVLPEISQRVLRMVSDPNVGMHDLANVIRQDQVIAISIMKMANSAVYGGLDEIKELNTACARLGMRNIANTVQMVANSNLYITGDQRLKNFMRKLWRHSIASAHCASEIANITAEPRAEMLFLAGLVQNVGKVVLLDIITGQYSGVIGKLRITPEVFREVLDNFHPLLGMHVVQAWNLPPEFVAATYFQSNPLDCPREDWLSIVHIVALASTIATVEGYGLYEVQDQYLSADNSARYLGLNDIKLAALRVDLADKLEALFNTVEANLAPADKGSVTHAHASQPDVP